MVIIFKDKGVPDQVFDDYKVTIQCTVPEFEIITGLITAQTWNDTNGNVVTFKTSKKLVSVTFSDDVTDDEIREQFHTALQAHQRWKRVKRKDDG